MRVVRAVGLGCVIVAGIMLMAGVGLWTFLFTLGLSIPAPSKSVQKRGRVEAYPQGGLLSPHVNGYVTIQGAPLPAMPEDVVRASIDNFNLLMSLIRKFGDTATLARGYVYLATLHAAIGEVDESERLFQQAEKILEKHPERAIDLTWAHNNHGLVQLDRGQYAEALRSFGAATHAAPKEWLFVPLQNLAATYAVLGQPAQAEREYLETLDVLQNMRQQNTMYAQTVRANLAVFYQQIGDQEGARALLEPLAQDRSAGRQTRTAVLNNLGHVYLRRKEFGKAEASFAEAEALAPKVSAWPAVIATNRAAMYNAAGRFADAETTGERALRTVAALYGESSPPAGAVLNEIAFAAMRRGEFAKAMQLASRATSIFEKQSDQEPLVRTKRVEALVAAGLGQHDRAVALSRDALVLAKTDLDRILEFGSEAQRLAYLSDIAPYDQLAGVGNANLLADAVLTMKGAVLESLLAERALAHASSPAEQAQLDHINQLKVTVMAKIGRGDRDVDEKVRELKKEQFAFSQKLAPSLNRKNAPVDVASVQAKLKHDQVLVEIIRYERYDRDKDVPAYGAVVISPRGQPSWVRLGDASRIDDEIRDVVARFGGGGRGFLAPGRADAVTSLRDLHDIVWKPLTKAFPASTKRVLISPDGVIAFLPWSVLLDDKERFLSERWELTQIGSGRDLLQTPRGISGTTLLALGDGASDLAHSRSEVDAIRGIASAHQWTATPLLGPEASERALSRFHGPTVLHIATHAGRFQNGLPEAVQTRLGRNPMYRGYILLGGGTDTLAGWTRGWEPPPGNDGILTAEEASALDLGKTWLTVLSACHSGAGDVSESEGVMGLRRGFALAGAENLVISLWSVDDEAGAEFMTAFYTRLFSNRDLQRSFRETQVQKLVQWRRMFGIEEAVRRAGGFVMTR